jgi:hypothetical protein
MEGFMLTSKIRGSSFLLIAISFGGLPAAAQTSCGDPSAFTETRKIIIDLPVTGQDTFYIQGKGVAIHQDTSGSHPAQNQKAYVRNDASAGPALVPMNFMPSGAATWYDYGYWTSTVKVADSDLFPAEDFALSISKGQGNGAVIIHDCPTETNGHKLGLQFNGNGAQEVVIAVRWKAIPPTVTPPPGK